MNNEVAWRYCWGLKLAQVLLIKITQNWIGANIVQIWQNIYICIFLSHLYCLHVFDLTYNLPKFYIKIVLNLKSSNIWLLTNSHVKKTHSGIVKSDCGISQGILLLLTSFLLFFLNFQTCAWGRVWATIVKATIWLVNRSWSKSVVVSTTTESLDGLITRTRFANDAHRKRNPQVRYNFFACVLEKMK